MGMPGIHAPIPNLPPGLFGPAQFSSRIAGISTPAKKAKRNFLPFVVDPNGMTQQEWSDAFVYAMSPVIALPHSQGDFEAWAAQITQEPQLQIFQISMRIQNWREWADELNAATLGAM